VVSVTVTKDGRVVLVQRRKRAVMNTARGTKSEGRQQEAYDVNVGTES
jgi:hypothetical protein